MHKELHKKTLVSCLLWALLAAGLVLGGCSSGNEDVDTDPTQGQFGDGSDDLEDVQLEDDPFGTGGATEQGTPESEELDAAEPAVELELTDVFFDFDSFELDAEARSALARNARVLTAEPGVDIVIEGHCDERGTVQYNLALGEKRARETRRYLVSLGVAPERIEIVSYGKERPFVEGTGEEVWSLNRRAHFVQEQ